MNLRELGPRDGNHFRGSVELHGARSEGNHGVGQGKILGFKVVDVPEHLSLGVVGVEDGVGQVRGGTLKAGGDSGETKSTINLDRRGRFVSGKDTQNALHFIPANSLVERETNLVSAQTAEEDRGSAGLGDNGISFRSTGKFNSQSVKHNAAVGAVRANRDIIAQADKLLAQQ